jgi:nitrogen-specific signal transduction histidine kinase
VVGLPKKVDRTPPLSQLCPPGAAALQLHPRAKREICAMINRVVGYKLLPAFIHQDIIDRTDGIPLLVEEMTKAVFATKPAGDGTGLGLSISHDIIVKQHSGSIEIESQPGEYTEVRIVLPRAVG